MGIRKVKIYVCDYCGKGTTLEGYDALLQGWREVRYLGNVVTGQTWTDTTAFCSLTHAGLWALKRAQAEQEGQMREGVDLEAIANEVGSEAGREAEAGRGQVLN